MSDKRIEQQFLDAIREQAAEIERLREALRRAKNVVDAALSTSE